MPSLSVQDATVGEFDGFVDIVVTLDTASTSAVSGEPTGSSTPRHGYNSDYRLNSGTLTFAPGETSKTVRIELINDTTIEDPGTLPVQPEHRDQRHHQPVRRDGADRRQRHRRQPAKGLRARRGGRREGRHGQLRRAAGGLRSGSRRAAPSAWPTPPPTARPWPGRTSWRAAARLSFAPGESVKTVVVDLLDDTTAEGTERFNLVLSSPLNAALADATAVAEIGPSDVGIASQPRIGVADVTVGEADGYVDLVVEPERAVEQPRDGGLPSVRRLGGLQQRLPA
jgi:hypothetical protein